MKIDKDAHQEYQAEAAAQFGSYRDRYQSQPVTAKRIQPAAPGLALILWRNTEAVESKMHSGRGLWSDADMLRLNAKATNYCWDMLKGIMTPDGKLRDFDATPGQFRQLQDNLTELLPAEPRSLRQGYRRSTRYMFVSLPSLLIAWGPDFWVHCMSMLQSTTWWCSPEWPELVDAYTNLPGDTPPDPQLFKQRMLECPWELDDEQAEYVVQHRYQADRLVQGEDALRRAA